MNLFFIYSKINIKYRNDVILAISKKYNHRIIIIKMLRIKHFNNIYFFTT